MYLKSNNVFSPRGSCASSFCEKLDTETSGSKRTVRIWRFTTDLDILGWREKKTLLLFLKGWPESLTVWYFGFGAVFYFSNYLWSGWIRPLVPTETPSDWSGWSQTKSHTIDHWPRGSAPSDICTRGSQGSVCQIEQFLNSSAFREAEAMGTVGVCPLLRCS